MAVKNLDFLGCREERTNESFFKVLQSVDMSSENMRAIPQHFSRKYSNSVLLSGKMEVRAPWGSSWEIQLQKNPRFYFMDKCGWDKFVRELGLVDSECLIFTHKGNLSFTLNIFKDDTEILQPHRSTSVLPSSKHGGKSTGKAVKNEEVVLSADLSYLGRRSPETSRAGKRKLSFEEEKTGDVSQKPKSSTKKKPVSAPRHSPGAPSSSLREFKVCIKKSYLNVLAIPRSIAQNHMPQRDTSFVIHDPDKKRSRTVSYLARLGHSGANSIFSAGWTRLASQYPLAVGDECKFTKLNNPAELLLQVI